MSLSTEQLDASAGRAAGYSTRLQGVEASESSNSTRQTSPQRSCIGLSRFSKQPRFNFVIHVHPAREPWMRKASLCPISRFIGLRFATALLVLVCTAPSPLHAASFDCAKASTKIEHLICDDAELSKLDEELDVAYRALHTNETQAAVARQSQRYWLKIRAEIGSANLLKSFYKRRIQLLTSGRLLLQEADKYRFEVSARAGEEGTQDRVPVCRDILASLKKLNKPPMICGQEFHPSFKQFSYPAWKKLDPREYRDLIMQIMDDEIKRDEINIKTRSPEIQESIRNHWQGAKAWLDEQAAHGIGSLYIATIPLHKGPRQVLSFELETDDGYGKCDGVNPENAYPRRYFIVDMESRRIDFEAMKNEYAGLFGNILADRRNGTLFLHNGIPFIALWGESLMFANNELWINGIKAESFSYIECFIEYNEDGRPYHD